MNSYHLTFNNHNIDPSCNWINSSRIHSILNSNHNLVTHPYPVVTGNHQMATLPYCMFTGNLEMVTDHHIVVTGNHEMDHHALGEIMSNHKEFTIHHIVIIGNHHLVICNHDVITGHFCLVSRILNEKTHTPDLIT